MIQLDLAIQAGFSTRPCELHRNRVDSAGPVGLLVLAETLRVPWRERNRLLEAGGFVHVYRQAPLVAEEMAHLLAPGRLQSGDGFPD